MHIACALYDEQGHIVNVALTFAEVDVLESGALAPFKLLVPEVHGQPANYHILAYAQQAEPYQIERQAEIEIVSTRAYEENVGKWVLIGEVQNVDQVPARFVQVAASIYDQEDNLIAVGSTFAWRSTLAPEHRSPFQIDLYAPPKGIDHWRLDVRGTRVPRRSWTTSSSSKTYRTSSGRTNRPCLPAWCAIAPPVTMAKIQVGVDDLWVGRPNRRRQAHLARRHSRTRRRRAL